MRFTSDFPTIIAHRGASIEFPENSLSSFKRAIEIHSHYIEVDLHHTLEGIPICIHDPSFTIDGQVYEISKMTLSEINNLRTGEDSIPTLDMLLALPLFNTGLMLELKLENNHPEWLVNNVIQTINLVKNTFVGNILIGSISLKILDLLKNQWPAEQTIGIIQDPLLIKNYIYKDFKYLAIYQKLINKENLQLFKESKKNLWTYTINDPKQAISNTENGIEGIITDDPYNIKQEFLNA